MDQRQIEGIWVQGSHEVIPWGINTVNVGTPSNPSAYVIRLSDNLDVTSAVMPTGSHTVSGTIITLKPLQALTAAQRYRVHVLYTAGAGSYENYFLVSCDF